MSRGFGATQPKRRVRKSLEQQAAKLRQSDGAASSQTSLEEDWQVNREKQALAWCAGTYNPLADINPNQVREIAADEEEWLFLARAIGWLQVDDDLDAIYFTAPPQAFDETQADWYLCPDLTTLGEVPILLKETIVSHSIPHELVNKIINRHATRLRWNPRKTAVFIQEVTDKPSAELMNEDCAAVLLELQRL